MRKTWPLCNGQFLPTEITFELIIELAHRLVSGAVGLMVLILSIWTWRVIGHIRETKFLSFLSLFFIVLQGLIGAAAVKWGQSDFVLALHFGISLISFAAVLLLTLLIFEIDKKFEADKLIIDKRMSFHIISVSIYSYLVIYTGALVRHTESSLVCRDWPLCINESPALPSNLYEWVQMGHRAAAGIIFIWIAYIAFLAFKNYRHQKVIYWGWITAFLLVSMQVLSGALVVLTRLNLYGCFVTCTYHNLFVWSLKLFSTTSIKIKKKQPIKKVAADRQLFSLISFSNSSSKSPVCMASPLFT